MEQRFRVRDGVGRRKVERKQNGRGRWSGLSEVKKKRQGLVDRRGREAPCEEQRKRSGRKSEDGKEANSEARVEATLGKIP